MLNRAILVVFLIGTVCPIAVRAQAVPDDGPIVETLDPATYGPAVVEDFQAVVAREAVLLPPPPKGQRNDAPGEWVVPTLREADYPNNTNHYIFNKWGDTRMGISFPAPVDVLGVQVFGQGARSLWTPGLRVVGYRDGQEVGTTEWFRNIGEKPSWFTIELRDVDRIVFEAEPAFRGAGYFALDDFTFAPHGQRVASANDVTVLTFEDVNWRTKLRLTQYGGLTWETSPATAQLPHEMPPPLEPPGAEETPEQPGVRGGEPSRAATAPVLDSGFDGVRIGDDGSYAIPPDTMGAVGPTKFVEVVNSNFAVYYKSGTKQIGSTLYAFFPDMYAGGGDPRVLFDHFSQRWIVICSDYDGGSRRINIAVSQNPDPASAFFKTSFTPGQGYDAGKWCDYPTLGVDENGIYIGAYMVGGSNQMTLFAIDKAPLIAWPQSLGTITAFRGLPWEGAIQPAHTYGSPGVEYCVSRFNETYLRVRAVNPPLTAPTLTETGLVYVGLFSSPPDAPSKNGALLDTVGDRLMMAVYRDGSLWTTHTVGYNGRAACRWYELDPAALSVVQSGIVSDPSLYYFFPAIMVNQFGHVVLGFTGSDANTYASAYFTGRRRTDTLGAMATPVLYKAGAARYGDPGGWERWGDYSYTTLDPADDTTFWTIQEYTRATSTWGTYVGALVFPAPTVCPGDCNCDGVVNFGDINPFVVAVLNQSFCDDTGANADLTGDTPIHVGFEDINPFVTLLTTNPLPIACP